MAGTIVTDLLASFEDASTASDLLNHDNINLYRTTLSDAPPSARDSPQWVPSDNDNATGHEVHSDVMIPLAERIIEGVLLSIIWVLAFWGNLFLWAVVFRRRSLRTVTNAMVLCLSFADLLVSSVNLPFTIVMVFMGKEWMFGKTLCILLGFINMLTFVASVMSLAAIGICRYLFIVHPLKFRQVYNRRNTGIIIAGVWLLAGLLASPPLFGWAVYDYLPGQSFCFCKWQTSVSYTFFMVGICFGGPCSVMTFCYVQILRVVRKSRQRVASTKRQSTLSTTAKLPPILRVPSSSTESMRGSRKTLNSCVMSVASSVSCRSSLSDNSSRPVSTEGLDDHNNKQDNSNKEITAFGNNLQVPPKTNQKHHLKATDDDYHQPDDNKSAGEVDEHVQIIPLEGDDLQQETTKSNCTSSFGAKSAVGKISTANGTLDNKRSEFTSSVSDTTATLSTTTNNKDRSSKIATAVVEDLPIEEDRPSFLARLSQHGNVMKSMVTTRVRGTRKSNTATDQDKRRRQEELKLTKSFVVVIFAFIICWMPFCVAMFWTVFGKNPPPRIFDMATLILGYSNSCCNPIIYGVMNRKFRAGYKDILLSVFTCCNKNRRKEHFKVRMASSSALGGGDHAAAINQAYARDSSNQNGVK